MFSPGRVCCHRSDAGFLSQWITLSLPGKLQGVLYLSQPSSDHGGEVLVLLCLSTFSTSSVIFYPSTWWLCQPAIGAQPDPIEHLLNPPHEQVTPAVGHLIHQGIHGLVPSLPSAHAAHLPKAQMPLRIALWWGDGNRRREQDKEMFLD